MTTTNNEIGERVAVIETKLDRALEDIAELKEMLTSDYAETKAKVKEIEETVEPFTRWRKRIWYLLVGVIVAGAIETALFITWAKDTLK